MAPEPPIKDMPQQDVKKSIVSADKLSPQCAESRCGKRDGYTCSFDHGGRRAIRMLWRRKLVMSNGIHMPCRREF
jgi:hypothetical protein